MAAANGFLFVNGCGGASAHSGTAEASMFERGLSNSGEKAKVATLLTLSNGEKVMAQIALTAGGRILDTLNRAEPFIEIDQTDGSSRIIAKQMIASVAMIQAPKADELNKAQKSLSFDPITILGLQPGASREEVRSAYLRQVKAYHPDRFTGLGLPREIEDYAASMLQRINAAYQALSPRSAVEEAA
jgi:hypothetical protein